MESVSITVPATKGGALMLASLAEVLANGPVSVTVAPTAKAPTKAPEPKPAVKEESPLNGASASDTAEDKPRRRRRRTKAEIEADAKAELSTDPFSDDSYDGMGDPEDDLGLGDLVSDTTKELDMDKDILPKFKALLDGDPKNGRAKAVKILEAYGVKSVRDIPKDKYAEVFAKL